MPPINSSFQRIPFIRISCLFMLGILVNHSIQTDDLWIGIALLLLITLLILLWNYKHFTGVKLQNILISLALFLSGIFYPYKVPENKSQINSNKDFYLAELCGKPSEKANSYQSVLLLKSKIPSRDEKVIVYFSKKGFDTTLTAGDQMVIHTALQQIKPKDNPFDIDYKTIMQNKGIYYSVYLPTEAYKKTGIQSNRATYFAERVRDKLTVRLYKSSLEQEERAIVSALTLGYRSEIDHETMDYFADTGTIHVLSVSGLHVALIFYILTLFLRPLKRGKFTAYFYPVLIIFCLWSYAFMTGFSPSVQRSTVMFSFVIVGNILRRPVSMYNSLLASALVLLLMDPNVLFDIGFQLSYLALFGIILLQPPLEKFILIKNKSLRCIWTLFTVSIAAQLITFPLSIFYFNQFPNLFWLSNFIAIPGTTVIIWLTFLFFLLSPIAIISNFLAVIIQSITHIMLFILKWISDLPHAVSEGIVYNSYQTLFLYGLIFAFIIYSFSKKKGWLFSGLILLILFQTSILMTKYDLFNQKIIYQYHTKNSIVHCINGRSNYIIRANNKPFDDREIQLIRNTCFHLKLHSPQVIMYNNQNSFTSNDITIRNNVLNFLSCRIILSDQHIFNINSEDIKQFQRNNPQLFTKTDIRHATSQPKVFHQKSSFSIGFKIQCNEAVCIFIN